MLQNEVVQKLLMVRRKVVVLENIFVDFVDCWLAKFLSDGQSTRYIHRRCLAPLIGHLVSHIKSLACLIVDKEKSKCYANSVFSELDIRMLAAMQLRPLSLEYFKKIEDRLVTRLGKYPILKIETR